MTAAPDPLDQAVDDYIDAGGDYPFIAGYLMSALRHRADPADIADQILEMATRRRASAASPASVS